MTVVEVLSALPLMLAMIVVGAAVLLGWALAIAVPAWLAFNVLRLK